MKQTTTLKQAIDEVIARMTGITTRKEIVEKVLKRYPSKAKNPASSIMNDLRWRKEIVALGDGRYARADHVLDGARFRAKVSAEDIALGKLQPSWFIPFDQVLPPIESIFVTSSGEVIPVVTKALDVSRLTDEQIESMLVSLGESMLNNPLMALKLPLLGSSEDEEDEEFDEEQLDEQEVLNQARALLKEKLAQKVKMHDFSDFYQSRQVREGDSLIVTMKPAEKTYIFEHEPASKAQTFLIKQRDQELSRFIHQAIKRNKREDARDVIFRAYGNLPWLKEYPSSHWLEIVENDDELRLISFAPNHLEIASIDYRMMLDMLGVDESTERKLQKRRTSIEQEVDDFVERLDAAYEEATEMLTEDFDEGGPDNLIAPARPARSEKKIAQRNDQLLEQFFEAEKKRKGEAAAGQKASDIALLADFLSSYQGVSLECATIDDLEEFFFDWYPRKVLNSTPAHARQLAASARDFYRFLVSAKMIRSARFAEALFKLRDLAGEKVELYDRLPAENSGELFARLFGGW